MKKQFFVVILAVMVIFGAMVAPMEAMARTPAVTAENYAEVMSVKKPAAQKLSFAEFREAIKPYDEPQESQAVNYGKTVRQWIRKASQAPFEVAATFVDGVKVVDVTNYYNVAVDSKYLDAWDAAQEMGGKNVAWFHTHPGAKCAPGADDMMYWLLSGFKTFVVVDYDTIHVLQAGPETFQKFRLAVNPEPEYYFTGVDYDRLSEFRDEAQALYDRMLREAAKRVRMSKKSVVGEKVTLTADELEYGRAWASERMVWAMVAKYKFTYRTYPLDTVVPGKAPGTLRALERRLT